MKALYQKYERHLTSLAFIVGFVFDSITLQQIDRWFEHVVLLAYLFVAAVAVIIYNSFDSKRERTSLLGRAVARVVGWFPIIVQFSLGAILSGSLVFYSRSASLAVSWPFIVLLLAFIVCNELIKSKYARLALQLSSLFAAVFLYASYAVPIVLTSISTASFLIAGLSSLVFIGVVGRVVRFLSPERFAKSRVSVWSGVLFVYIGFHFLYFANLIPPLPLSLHEIGIYHSVARTTSGDYVLRYEKAPWYHLREISSVFHAESGETAYAFSSVSAPTTLSVTIMHEWFYRLDSGAWVSAGEIPFSIVGGREKGYRGYSVKKIFPGEWRVEVKTVQGRRIGRTSFFVTEEENRVEIATLLR